ncbi:MAG: hypothetical protein IT428_11725, partial [Planctomycetaceae bacterium]|nr:hypothetical protein [Planctomycetaceae bacterium]
VYDELHKIAAGQMAGERRKDHNLQTTALINEAYLRLMHRASDATGAPPALGDLRAANNRRFFYFVAARAMRQLLIEQERKRRTPKRGGGWNRRPDDALMGESAPVGMTPADGTEEHPWDCMLDQIRGKYGVGFGELAEVIDQLAAQDEQAATIVWLRFLGGLTTAESAEELGIPETEVESEWRFAKKWLKGRLQRELD